MEKKTDKFSFFPPPPSPLSVGGGFFGSINVSRSSTAAKVNSSTSLLSGPTVNPLPHKSAPPDRSCPTMPDQRVVPFSNTYVALIDWIEKNHSALGLSYLYSPRFVVG